ncbi:MAG: hypothetical protein GY946_11790 [bacterium]|nr:hypothetical protein [bacterium]
MRHASRAELEAEVLQQLGCGSSYVEAEFVRQTWKGKVAWDGMVYVLRLTGHPDARYCYVLPLPSDNGQPHQYHTILESMTTGSPTAAVRAYIKATQQD